MQSRETQKEGDDLEVTSDTANGMSREEEHRVAELLRRRKAAKEAMRRIEDEAVETDEGLLEVVDEER